MRLLMREESLAVGSLRERLHREHLGRRTKFFPVPAPVAAPAADIIHVARRRLEVKQFETPARIPVERIQMVVAKRFKLTREEILSPRRQRRLVRPRQLAMYLAKIGTKQSLLQIGRRFGRLDHTTIIHAVKKITAKMESEPEYAEMVESIKRELGFGGTACPQA